MRRETFPRFCRSGWLFLLVAAWVSGAGCEAPPKTSPVDEQIAQRIEPVEQHIRQQQNASETGRKELSSEIRILQAALETEHQSVVHLTERVAAAEQALASYAALDLPAVAKAQDATRADLNRLNGEHTGFVYKTRRQFEDFKLIHANFAQADEDLRKLIATSITGLERRSNEAREKLRRQLEMRFEEDRSLVMTAFGDLEQRVLTGSARTATAMQLLREFLTEEHEAANHYAARLKQVRDEIDRQFAADGAEAREAQAAGFFAEAQKQQRAYLADRNHPETREAAILAYRKGLEIRPDAAEMHFALGELLRDAGQEEAAAPHLRYYLKNGIDKKRRARASKWLGAE